MTDVPGDVPTDVAGLAKKSSVSWIRAGTETYPVWHEWVETEADGVTEGAICVVGSPEAGGSEQPVPPLADGDTAIVMLRSKTDRQLAAAVPVVVSVVNPGSDLWESVTAALKSGRLNARDMPDEIDRWARECRVLRLIPNAPATAAGELPGDVPRTRPRLS